MSTDPVLNRLRAANPAPMQMIDNEGLRARLLAAPGDPRLLSGSLAKRWWRRRSGQTALLFAALALTAAGGTAAVVGLGPFAHARPTILFRGNPQSLGAPWSRRQTVIPSTVRRLQTLTLPGVGKVQYWVAQSEQHGLCQALRLPDGGWSGLGYSRYDQGGDVPGCIPAVHQGEDGIIHGFFYVGSLVGPRQGPIWRVEFGIVVTKRTAVAVRDRRTGITGRVFDDHYFVIALPYSSHAPTRNMRTPGFQLEALDSSGRVIDTALPD